MGNGSRERLLVKIVVGHESILLDRPNSEGHTHQWTIFVRSVTSKLVDRQFVKQVQFRLHESFKPPLRAIQTPPFEVTETGYGSFNPEIIVHFNYPNAKPFKFPYDLVLTMDKKHINQQEMIFEVKEDVPVEFLDMVRKYCDGKKKKRESLDSIGPSTTKRPKIERDRSPSEKPKLFDVDMFVKKDKSKDKVKDRDKDKEKKKKKRKEHKDKEAARPDEKKSKGKEETRPSSTASLYPSSKSGPLIPPSGPLLLPAESPPTVTPPPLVSAPVIPARPSAPVKTAPCKTEKTDHGKKKHSSDSEQSSSPSCSSTFSSCGSPPPERCMSVSDIRKRVNSITDPALIFRTKVEEVASRTPLQGEPLNTPPSTRPFATMGTMKVRKCPTDELALSNCAVVSSRDFDQSGTKHVLVKTGPAHHFVFTIRNHPSVNSGEIAFAVPQRNWATLTLDQDVQVQPHTFKPNEYVAAITVSVDFKSKKNATQEPLNSDHMAKEFSISFSGKAFTKQEQFIFAYTDDKGKTHTLTCFVKNIEGLDLSAAAAGPDTSTKSKPFPLNCGQLLPNSAIVFDKEENAIINLVGKSKGKSAYRSIINPDWDFQKMGIGGLDKEFSGIFRRAFASRVFPPEFIEQLGMKHVRGILLFGPPGTGKTLMARQIGKMLNAREPKIVNGPQILDKYVGESESNVRKLFADAEEEWRRCGANSGLHIIIFDEIDAICKQRGSMAGSSSVHDTVVNQLLSKMDGVEQLNNILVIGMTNRKDMIDEALLRPGRLEVQMEVSLPDEFGRQQILKIHTIRMREYKKLDPKVNLDELAKKTKNFSGAEIEGLVRAAQSSAMNRLVKAGGKVQLDPDAIEKLMISEEDFEYALENDIKPAFGRSDESLEKFLRRGLVTWGPDVTRILEEGDLLVQETKNPDSGGFVTAVLAGPPRSGKSCLAAMIAKNSEFPFVKVVSPGDMVGFSESAKCQAIRKAFQDALKSKLSVLLIDNIERLLDYSPVGPRYSNLVLQALLVLLNEPPPLDHRLLVLATSSNRSFLRELELMNVFGHMIDVPVLTKSEHVLNVLSDSEAFRADELQSLGPRLQQLMGVNNYGVGIKRLLDLIDFSRQCQEGYRASTLFSKLEAIALGCDA